MKKKLLWGLTILAGIIGLYAAVMLLQRFTATAPVARPPAKLAAPHKTPAAKAKTSLAAFAKTKAAKRSVTQAKAGPYKLTHAITLNQAAEAALSNTAQGLKDLQDYFDAAGGNEKQLKARADALLKTLAAGPAAKNFSALGPASERLLSAFRRSGTAAYQLPLYVGDAIGLGKDQKGWDFGPGAKRPYVGFIRVGVTDPNLSGHELKAIETSPKSLLLSDGDLEVTGYGAELKAGTYQVYIVAGNLPEPSPAPTPFGSGVRSNGTEIDLVDMSDGKFGGYGLLTSAGPEIIGLQDETEGATRVKTIKNRGAEGKLLVTHAFVEGSTLRIELDDPGIGTTYISGIIIAPSDLDRLDKQLQDDIGALLAGLEPGYGSLPPRSHGFFFTSPAPVGSALSQLPGILSHYATQFDNSISSGSSSGSGSSGAFGGSTTSSTSGGSTTSGGGSASGSSGGTASSGGSSGGSASSSTSSGGIASSSGSTGSTTSGGTTSSSTSGGTTTSSTSGGSTTSGSSGGSTTSSTSGGSTTSSTSGGTTTSSTSGGSTTSGSSGGSTTSSTSGGSTTSSTSGGTTTSSTSGGSTTSGSSSGSTTSSTSGGSTTSSTSGGTTTSSTSGGATSTSSGGTGGHQLVANAGLDLAGPLGGSFNLDLCPSTFDDVSLCAFTAPYLQQNFTMEWLLNTTSLGFAHDTTPFHLDTGLFSALFDNPGDYLISLKLTYIGSLAPLDSGDSMKLTLFIPPPVIAEPAAGLIFLAGLGGLGLALRRRRGLK